METLARVLQKLRPSGWSLGRKFLSIMLLVLLIPFLSVGLLKEIEKALSNNLKDNLLLSASLMGNQLSKNSSWFEKSILPDSKQYIGDEIFVFPLDNSFNLDGYLDDWGNFEQHRKLFSISNYKTTDSFSLLLGYFERHFIISLSVIDQNPIYSVNKNSGNDASLINGVYDDNIFSSHSTSDQFIIEFVNGSRKQKKLMLNPSSSGRISVYSFKDNEPYNDFRYKAYWIETTTGYDIELKFPTGVKPSEIKIIKNSQNAKSAPEFDHSYSSSRYGLNPIVWPSRSLINYVNQSELKTAQRMWVLDNQKRVMATNGNLQTNQIEFSSNPILNWILANQNQLLLDPRKDSLRLNAEGVYLALKGTKSARIEHIQKTGQSIAMATFPITNDHEVIGVLVLEENVARVQLAQQKTLINMFIIILTVMVFVSWILFWYVSRLVSRVKELNRSVVNVVDNHGRMKEPVVVSNEIGDEIDLLTTSFSLMSNRLYDYNDYLEKLASRLSHELRTPIAIVRSSLDNLLLNENDPEQIDIIERALLGNKRLGEIISRMKNASGIKEAMQSAVLENTNLNDFLGQLIKGYQVTYPNHRLELEIEPGNFEQLISKDLFAEMLDKLVSNAVSFSNKKQPICIELLRLNSYLQLRVSNSGKIIPKKDTKKIFRSLVSIRKEGKTNDDGVVNLGLGLYVVKLIADFHRAKVKVENWENQEGVTFTVTW